MMSDSGRQIGDCPHGHLHQQCVTCLLSAADDLRRQRDELRTTLRLVEDYLAVLSDTVAGDETVSLGAVDDILDDVRTVLFRCK